MPYFDKDADAWMVRPTHRDAQHLGDALRVAEDEIVRHYTRTTQDSTLAYELEDADVPAYVHLHTYRPDPADAAVSAAFKVAMKHAIAEAVVWVIEQWTELEPLIRDEAGKGKTRTFRLEAHDPLPPEVTRWLARWDLRAPCYSI